MRYGSGCLAKGADLTGANLSGGPDLRYANLNSDSYKQSFERVVRDLTIPPKVPSKSSGE
jgi:uncharacterized protein YjbI with pentapeptide repeats